MASTPTTAAPADEDTSGEKCRAGGATVYCLRFGAEDIFKIGHTSDVRRRVQQLRTGTPVPLKVVHTVQPEVATASAVEADIHTVLGQYRIQPPRDVNAGTLNASAGREFFRLQAPEWDEARLRDLMSRVCKECDADARDREECEALAHAADVDADAAVDVADDNDAAFVAELLQQRAQLHAQQAAAARGIARIDYALKRRIGGAGRLRDRAGGVVATWLPYKQKRLDRARLRKVDPALEAMLERYMVKTQYRRFTVVGSCMPDTQTWLLQPGRSGGAASPHCL